MVVLCVNSAFNYCIDVKLSDLAIACKISKQDILKHADTKPGNYDPQNTPVVNHNDSLLVA